MKKISRFFIYSISVGSVPLMVLRSLALKLMLPMLVYLINPATPIKFVGL